jgi:thioredoxin 1
MPHTVLLPAIRRLRPCLVLSCTLALTAATVGENGISVYEEAADASQDVQRALATSQQDGTPVLVVFGANWCGDCKVLDLALRSGRSSGLVHGRFHVVKVYVGRFDRNLDVAARHDVPLKRSIPAVEVLSSQGKPVYVTRAGERADARTMGDAGLHDFFSKVAADAQR